MQIKRTITHKNNTEDCLLMDIEKDDLIIVFTINQPAKGPIANIFNDLNFNHHEQIIKVSNTYNVIKYRFTRNDARTSELAVLSYTHKYFPFNKEELIELARVLEHKPEIVFEALPKCDPKIDDSQSNKLEELKEQIEELKAKVNRLEEQLKKNSEPARSSADELVFFNSCNGLKC
ncbi:MAG: hypothetical protein EPN84_08510 [Legionella sp.]|nr:MAG: hypothetical protein EPN84_08510 [Legionella sp.]